MGLKQDKTTSGVQELGPREVAEYLANGDDNALWNQAKEKFARENQPSKHASSKKEAAFTEFLQNTGSISDTKRLCEDVEKSADAGYETGPLRIKGKVFIPGTWLKQTIAAIDKFIAVADVAMKGGAESVALGWTAVRWILLAVKADAARMAQMAQASAMIARMLVTCKAIGKMYYTAKNTTPSDLVQQLLGQIPTLYYSILTYSWSAKLQVDRSAGRRMIDSIGFSSSAGNASQGAFENIQRCYEQIQKDGQQAFQEFVDDSFKSVDETQRQILTATKEAWDANQKQMTEFTESLNELLAGQKQLLSGQQELLSGQKNLTSEIKKIQMTPYQADLSRFEEYKKKLDPSEHSARLRRLKLDAKEPDTCTWIFETPEYQDWVSAKESSLLRIYGNSGFGKSVITSTVIERLLQQSVEGGHKQVVAYYYFVNGGRAEGTQTTTRLFHDIIFHLYDHARLHENSLAEVNRIFVRADKDSKDKPSNTNTANSGSSASKDKKKRSGHQTAEFLGNPDETIVSIAKILKHDVYIVIDALDECFDREETDLFESIHSWLKETGTSLKIFVSSRPEQDIQKELGRYPSIDLSGRNTRDIVKRTDAALSSFVHLTPLERKVIQQKMIEKAQSQFTYIDLAIKILNQPWIRPITNVTAKFQNGVSRLYQETLRSTDANYKDLAVKVLVYTLLKQDDLTISDFYDMYSQRYTATEVLDDEPIVEPEQADTTAKATAAEANLKLYADQINEAARTFVRITANDTLQVQHQNVRECFLNADELDEDARDTFRICPVKHHLEITLHLLKALNSPAFQKDHMPLPIDEFQPETSEETQDPPLSHETSLEEPSAVEHDEGHSDHNDHSKGPAKGASGGESTAGPDTSTPWSIWTNLQAKQEDADDGAAHDKESSESEAGKMSENQEKLESSENLPEQENGPIRPSHAPEDRGTEEAKIGDSTETENNDKPPADDDEDIDSDDEEIEERLNLPSSADDQQPAQQSARRYEIWNWFRHLKSAEQAAGPTDTKRGALWDEVWEELRTMLLNKKTYRAWCSAIREQADDSSMARYWYVTGEPEHNFTPFHICAGLGLTWALERMVEEGADLQVLTVSDLLPIHLVGHSESYNEDKELWKLLLKHNDMNYKDPKEQGMLYAFTSLMDSMDADEEVVRLLVESGANPCIRGNWDRTALHFAAWMSHKPSVIRYLVEKGLDINAEDEDGQTPLHIYLRRDEIDSDMLRTFLDLGADPTWESKASIQPLVGAAENGQLKAVEILLEARPGRPQVEIDDENEDGKTALHEAAYCKHTEIIECLLSHKAEINHKSHKGTTPLFYACIGSEQEASLLLIKRLLECGHSAKEIDQVRYNNKTVLRQASLAGQTDVVKALLDIPGMLERIDYPDNHRHRTPLHVAALMGHEETTRVLLEKGAKMPPDRKGKTPLQLAYARWASGNKVNHEPIVTMLVEHDPEAAREDPNILFTAASFGSLKLVQRLLEIGANPNVQDNHGWKPVHVARQNGHLGVVHVLDQGGVFGHPPSRLILPNDQKTTTYDEETQTYTWTYAEPGEAHALLADHPVRVGDPRFYYEVEIQADTKEKESDITVWIAIGLSQSPYNVKGWGPGLEQRGVKSWAFHGDDGMIYNGTRDAGKTVEGFAPFSHEVTIGCGYDATQNSIFYTRDGKFLDTAFTGVSGRLFPCVSMRGESKIKANLTGPPGNPFLYEKMNLPSRVSTSRAEKKEVLATDGAPSDGASSPSNDTVILPQRSVTVPNSIAPVSDPASDTEPSKDATLSTFGSEPATGKLIAAAQA